MALVGLDNKFSFFGIEKSLFRQLLTPRQYPSPSGHHDLDILELLLDKHLPFPISYKHFLNPKKLSSEMFLC